MRAPLQRIITVYHQAAARWYTAVTTDQQRCRSHQVRAAGDCAPLPDVHGGGVSFMASCFVVQLLLGRENGDESSTRPRGEEESLPAARLALIRNSEGHPSLSPHYSTVRAAMRLCSHAFSHLNARRFKWFYAKSALLLFNPDLTFIEFQDFRSVFIALSQQSVVPSSNVRRCRCLVPPCG